MTPRRGNRTEKWLMVGPLKNPNKQKHEVRGTEATMSEDLPKLAQGAPRLFHHTDAEKRENLHLRF